MWSSWSVAGLGNAGASGPATLLVVTQLHRLSLVTSSVAVAYAAQYSAQAAGMGIPIPEWGGNSS
ncbi:MAG: hypothetical protein NVS3B1_11680 [Marmoricola sp.]